ncbi:COG3500 Phage protein D [uncultured Caudovirales phage]|uniref:COG3500 Phage protein D n=1 Tax=uncultured Caudovirales phage TaxID=2100421 RepID=A0A6J5QRT0_9CAUD|nr:COG3500 Phage protein D [uncultured Caudovirales phage]CAB4193198.1 COG3500 Phage protein D [uncultured Caudovirales phage]CAB4217825.1 COG3500 Phage protein D [uncultured Caudovirales phage]CAB5231642.1 COG3500 Phage protein D [uncultured Caudovirales phage]
MKSPFYKVFLSPQGQDEITQFIERIKFDDTSDKDSMVEFTARLRSLELLENTKLVRGRTIYFQFGYIGGKMSVVHKGRISDLDCKYDGAGITVTVRALDMGNAMRKVATKKVWQKKTTSQIAKEIAAKYGLEYEGDDTEKSWDFIPQAGMSDFAVLQSLVEKEAGGDYLCYVRSGKLHLEKRKTDSDSALTLTWGVSNTIISFVPKERDSTGGSLGTTSVDSFDPDAKTARAVQKDPSTADGVTALGDKIYEYSGETGELLGVKTPAPVKTVPMPSDDNTEVTNRANHSAKKAGLGQLAATLQVEGNPTLRPNLVLTINGVARRHIGNWLIKSVSHDISGSGYITNAELVKNGSKTSGKKATKKNETIGPDKAKTTQPIATKVYDQNGNQVTDPAILAERNNNLNAG